MYTNGRMLTLREGLEQQLTSADTAMLLDICLELELTADKVPVEVREHFNMDALCVQFMAAFDAGNRNKALMIIQLILTHETLKLPEARYIDILTRMMQLRRDPSVDAWRQPLHYHAAGRMKDAVQQLIMLIGNETDPHLKRARMQSSVEACQYGDSLLYQIIHLPRRGAKSDRRARDVQDALNIALINDSDLTTIKRAYKAVRGPDVAPPLETGILFKAGRQASSFWSAAVAAAAVVAHPISPPSSPLRSPSPNPSSNNL
jgi:hypothetical protein